VKKIQLPSLAFGSRNAHIDRSEHEMADRLKILANGLPIFDSLAKPGEFMSLNSDININGLAIGALVNSPMRVAMRNGNTSMLIIPFSGSGLFSEYGEKIVIRADNSAALLAGGDFTGESGLISSMAIFINSDRLECTVRSMIGIKNTVSNLIDLDRPQELALQSGGIEFDRIFKKLAGLIDLLSITPGLLNLSGIDDQIYRAMAMILKPALFSIDSDHKKSPAYSKNLLDRACQYIKEHQNELITMTDLERVSCMSGRNLQYAFQETFACTPMQWVRVQRLETARSMLIRTGSSLTVTTIAFLCGFNKPSAFSYYYNLRFGELPSETIVCRQ